MRGQPGYKGRRRGWTGGGGAPLGAHQKNEEILSSNDHRGPGTPCEDRGFAGLRRPIILSVQSLKTGSMFVDQSCYIGHGPYRGDYVN